MTDHAHSLTQRSFTAAAWSLILQFCGQLINPLFGIILARKLLPDDYGLLGMLGIFWAVGALFADGGFGIALVQKKDVSEVEYSSVFYYNLLLGIVLYGLLALAAPWIAGFYSQPQLVPIIRLTALTFPIGAVGSIPAVILQKQLNQKALALNRIVVMTICGLLAIFLCYSGYGVWSLVWQQVSSSLLGTLLLIAYVRWRPLPAFSLAALKGLFRFGSRMFASGLLNCLFDNLYDVIIGKGYKASELGFYARARSYSGMWPLSISGTVSSVTLPAFVQIQDQKERVRHAFRRSLVCVTAVVALPSVMLFVLSRPLVSLLITDRWLPIVPYMWLLIPVYLLLPLHIINLQLLTARGRSDLFLRLEIVKKALIVVNLALTFRLGVMWMIAGQLIVSLLSALVNGHYTCREIGYPVWRQFRDIAPPLLYASVTGLAAWLLHRALAPVNPWLAVAAPILLAPPAYVLLNAGLRSEASRMMLELLAQRYPGVPVLGRARKWACAE